VIDRSEMTEPAREVFAFDHWFGARTHAPQ
jgi:hypothetical protein